MAKGKLVIGGTEYPSRPTMGAMLRFKKETGKEVTEISNGSLSDLCTYMYCCVASASAADGVEFNLSLMEFADRLSPEEMTEWANGMQPDEGKEGPGKKTEALRHI